MQIKQTNDLLTLVHVVAALLVAIVLAAVIAFAWPQRDGDFVIDADTAPDIDTP